MRKAKILTATVSALLVTVACTPSGSQQPAEGGDSDAAAAVKQPATGQLTYESWSPTQATLDKLIKGFKEQNPDVVINSKLSPAEPYETSLQAALRSGTGPDVFMVSPGQMFNKYRRYMEPIDAYAQASLGTDWRSQFLPESIDRATSEGKTYGLPTGYNVAGLLWVNTALLDQAGVAKPTNYAELVAASKKLAAQRIAPIAMGGKDDWQLVDHFMTIASGLNREALDAAMEKKGPWTDPALVEAFATWKRLFDDQVVQDGAAGAATYNDSYDLFTNGKAAFFANGSWNLDMFTNSLDKIKDFNVEAIPFPLPSGPAPVIGDPNLFVINKNSKNKAAAYRFIEYVTKGAGGQTLQNAFLDFPVTSDGRQPQNVPQEATKARNQIQALIDDRLAGYRQPPSPAVFDAIVNSMSALATGSLTPQDAASRAQQAADDG